MTSEFPLEPLLSPAYRFGKFAVQIFWAISGFIFFWKYAEAIQARTIQGGRFLWLRFSRLYPLHLVTLLLVAALQPIYVALAGEAFVFRLNDANSFLIQLFLADQWAGARDMSFNGPIWSVSAEIFVYAAFFLSMRTFGRRVWLFAGALAAGLACLWTDAISPALICGAYFFAGGIAAEVHKRLDSKARLRLGLLATIGSLAVGLLLLSLTPSIPGDNVIGTWLLLAAPSALLLAAQDFRPLDRWERLCQAAGNLTYSTYLIHFPLQLIIAILSLEIGVDLPISEPWFLFAYLFASVGIGRLVFVNFEAPAQRALRIIFRPQSLAAASS